MVHCYNKKKKEKIWTKKVFSQPHHILGQLGFRVRGGLGGLGGEFDGKECVTRFAGMGWIEETQRKTKRV
jgi:hypothetical protein